MKEKVIVGMSGGVDSSVTAYLLQQQGYEVIGITMDTHEGESACCGSIGAQDARKVAHTLGIPHYVIDFKKEFKKNVMDYFIEEYLQGRTPNPCIACNRYVKWEALLQRGMELGADYIATGHYAQVIQLENGRYALKKSVSEHKDQTYALYNLNQAQLARTLMPLGNYEKDQVRAIAAEIGLVTANKPDSQEICFIPDNDYAGFIQRECENVPPAGNFVDKEGNIVGQHKGITHYTIGQRKGLNLAMGHPVFVTEIRPSVNEVVIGENEDVWTRELYCNQLNCMAVESFQDVGLITGKIRYGHQGEMCTVEYVDENTLHCVFKEPVRAVTPGQAVVFYKENIVLGGGTIQK
jgi:tRNA-specific 2-thiouridylase